MERDARGLHLEEHVEEAARGAGPGEGWHVEGARCVVGGLLDLTRRPPVRVLGRVAQRDRHRPVADAVAREAQLHHLDRHLLASVAVGIGERAEIDVHGRRPREVHRFASGATERTRRDRD